MTAFDASALNPGVARKEVLAWSLYDFANSGYTTVVLTTVFAQYFTGVVAAHSAYPTTVWTWTLAASNALVLLCMPMIGAWADLHARKKGMLLVATAGAVVGTAALASIGRGEVFGAAAALMASNFFFMVGMGLISAFLPELARPGALGRVSGWGWALGYLGGLFTLGLCLVYVAWARAQGQGPEQFVPATMLITACVFALAATPTFIWLRERAAAVPDASAVGRVRLIWARLAHTAQRAAHFQDFSRVLLCGVCYQAGVAVVITLAAIYAADVMHFDFEQTMLMVLLVNITASLGALAFGYVQDALGHKRALALTLFLWLAMIVVAAMATQTSTFWVAANLAGLAMGSSQSAGRAFIGALAPPAQRAEFYGLWTVATQIASILGPASYGLAMWLSSNNHRQAIASTGVFFLLALWLLGRIDVARGMRAAQTNGLEP